MPKTDGHDSPSPLPSTFRSPSPLRSIGRSIFSPRREHGQSMEAMYEYNFTDSELESFQKQIVDRFHELSGVNTEELLSIDWIKKLLESFINFQEDFKLIMLKNESRISKPLLDEYLQRSVKALDICNTTRRRIEKLRLWQKHLEIVLCALDSGRRAIGKAQFRRAKKALANLELAMKDSYPHSHRRNNPSHYRSISWSFPISGSSLSYFPSSYLSSSSSSFSGAKQIQTMANSVSLPRVSDIISTNGLALTSFTLSWVLVFVLWSSFGSIFGQERGFYSINLSIPRYISWGFPLLLLHERIVEESKKRNCSNGFVNEIFEIQKCARNLMEMVDVGDDQFPITEQHKIKVEKQVQEMAFLCDAFNSGLDSLDEQIKELFHKITCFRNHIYYKYNLDVK